MCGGGQPVGWDFGYDIIGWYGKLCVNQGVFHVYRHLQEVIEELG